MASSDGELEEQLLQAGNRLVEPPSSVDELLSLLDVKSPNFCFSFLNFVPLFVRVSVFDVMGFVILGVLLVFVIYYDISLFASLFLCCMLCSCMCYYFLSFFFLLLWFIRLNLNYFNELTAWFHCIITYLNYT